VASRQLLPARHQVVTSNYGDEDEDVDGVEPVALAVAVAVDEFELTLALEVPRDVAEEL